LVWCCARAGLCHRPRSRPYAGWFLITGGLLLILHASLRQMSSKLRSVPVFYAIVIAAATPAVRALTSQDSLS